MKNIINTINIKDVNFLFSSEKIGFHLGKAKSSYLKKGILYSFFFFFFNWIKKQLEYHFKSKKIKQTNDIIFLSFTNNQRESAETLKEYYPESAFIGNHDFGKFSLPEHKAYLYALPYLRKTFSEYKKSAGYYKDSFKYYFWQYWLTYGYFKMLKQFFLRNNVRTIVVTNDHIMRTRIVAYVAKAINGKSIYYQHASVTNKFPNLIFDYAILEGKDTLEKYIEIGDVQSTVFIVGNLKRTSNYLLNQSNQVNKIGICFGINDLETRIIDLISIVTKMKLFDLIIVRPHPGDNRTKLLETLVNQFPIQLSNSKIEKVDDFLNNVDCVISGESNIHLDAVSKNIETIYFNLNIKSDHYNFIKNNLIKYVVENESDLMVYLAELNKVKPNVMHRAKHYDALIGTAFYGKSQYLYSQVINSIHSNDYKFIKENFNELSPNIYEIKS